MGREQQPGGDYGYDMAHEDVPPTAPTPDAASGDAPSPTGAEDRAGDYGYDEAHDF